ncbi:MAG: fibronectin type III domain-containing protein [Bacillota bacterium]
MVTVVGVLTYTDPDDGSVVNFLAFHDPASRPGPSTDIYPVFLTKLYGYRYSPGKTKDGYEIHIRYAFAESPVAEFPAGEKEPVPEAPPAGEEPATGETPSAEEKPSTRERYPGEEPAPVPPARPTTVKADNSKSCRITVSWKDCSNDEDGFEIERKGLFEKDWTVVHTTGPNATAWTNSGYAGPPMQGGAVYCYRIRAYKVVDAKRLYSDYSETASA